MKVVYCMDVTASFALAQHLRITVKKITHIIALLIHKPSVKNEQSPCSLSEKKKTKKTKNKLLNTITIFNLDCDHLWLERNLTTLRYRPLLL